MSIIKGGALDTYMSVHVLVLVCDCLSTEALRAAMCQVPQTLEATLATMQATLGVASATPGILLLQRCHRGQYTRSRKWNSKLSGNS